ncbi:MAG: DUF1932 domain-containing protein [Acidimicrobiales bacterium]
MTFESVGIISPGAMGAAVGQTLVRSKKVLVALEGRSQATRARASAAGLSDVGDVASLVDASELVLSIAPPGSAIKIAGEVAQAMDASGKTPLFVDANAVSPARATQIRRMISKAGAAYVDGGIVGGPPRGGARTDLFVSGAGAEALAQELSCDELVVSFLGDDPTAASALKMCFAAWTKGTAALLIAIRAVATRDGVDSALAALWERVQPNALAGSQGAGMVASRAWRWVDEMREISRTFEDAGLDGGAAMAAANLYSRLTGFKDHDRPVSLPELLEAIG